MPSIETRADLFLSSARFDLELWQCKNLARSPEVLMFTIMFESKRKRKLFLLALPEDDSENWKDVSNRKWNVRLKTPRWAGEDERKMIFHYFPWLLKKLPSHPSQRVSNFVQKHKSLHSFGNHSSSISWKNKFCEKLWKECLRKHRQCYGNLDIESKWHHSLYFWRWNKELLQLAANRKATTLVDYETNERLDHVE